MSGSTGPQGTQAGPSAAADLLWYIDKALDDMVAIVEALGDDRANQRPGFDGANSPFAILTHCLGVMEFWAGAVVAGRTIERDRAAEFRASGPVEDLVAKTREARRRLAADLAQLDRASPPPGPVRQEDAVTPLGRTQTGVVLHILEELYQHLGQMELTRDVLLAGS